jgi:hypothetical protein
MMRNMDTRRICSVFMLATSIEQSFFLEKLVIPQLIKKFVICGTRRFITVVTDFLSQLHESCPQPHILFL